MFVKFEQGYRHWLKGHVYDLPDGQAELLIHRTLCKKVRKRGGTKRKRSTGKRAG